MEIDSTTQIDQITDIFGSQVALARAVGIDPRNVTEWRRRELGIPTKHYRAIFHAAAAIEKETDLPGWFPRFASTDAAA